ncbi:MAG: T9SS type A sorting domain-containing protein [Cytophagaceae bacterium]|nr:T9SS type A sorting domain-containing protein [Cytophagaceae bacterium]
MKNCYILLFLLSLLAGGAGGQKSKVPVSRELQKAHPLRDGGEIVSLPPIICYYTNTPTTAKPIGPPEFFLRRQRQDSRARVEATRSDIIVTYDAAFPDSAKVAFEYAVGIWESWLISPIPIRISARWQNLGAGTLGSTGPKIYRNINFSGTLKANTFYVLPLAEKLTRRNLNGNQSDIDMTFGSAVNWYVGTDQKTRANRQDFVSTVVHEIGHGLGFTDSFVVEGNLGQWGEGYNIPRSYDHYIVNNQGQQLLNTTLFPSPSSQLRQQLVSNNVFFDSPLTRAANNGERAKLYAPTTYRAGSQIAHLDETTYPSGSINSCMTPFGNSGEVTQNPGPIVFGIFSEMGWRATSVLHERQRDSEELNQAVTFRTTVVSDTTLLPGSVKLFYTVNDTAVARNATQITLTRVGNTDEYTANLPGAATNRTVRYYITAQDASGRTFSSPPDAPRFHWVFQQGPDTTPPTIVHAPVATVFGSEDSLRIIAQIEDDYEFGIDTAYVEWRVNGVEKPAFRLRNNSRNDVYQGAVALTGQIKGGDEITYRIVARDRSKRKNQTVSPATGFYAVRVLQIKAAQTSYVNNFDTPTDDFAGNGFSITTPTGFSNPAIHSDHPYRDGNGFPNNQLNLLYQLLVPITLKDQETTIRFDEVVLVEPGEEGSIFGDSEFFDYVVVEGSRDGGKTWRPFADGYNSRDTPAWKTAFDARIDKADNNSSLTVGTSALFRPREIDMLNSGNFIPGDRLLIRFRLFADQLSHGWGWAIDNLAIQTPKPPPVTSLPEPVIETTEVKVYPNPSSTGEFMLEGRFTKLAGHVDISVVNVMGSRVYNQHVARPTTLSGRLDLSTLTPGIYLVHFDTDEGRITKRVVIAK